MKTSSHVSLGISRSFEIRFIARHARRNLTKTLLMLLMSALLVGIVGQLAQLRNRYADLVSSFEINVYFYDGLSYSQAGVLEKSGYLRDPFYIKTFDAVNMEIYYPVTLAFTNRIDILFSEPITWLEGWDETSCKTATGKYCLMPAPLMEEMGFQLGDEVRINERDCISNLLNSGQFARPTTVEEEFALRDAHRPKFKIIGRIETTDTQMMIVAFPKFFSSYSSFLGAVLYFDRATYKLCSYHDAEEFRTYIQGILLALREPPLFRMDTTDADRLNSSYLLLKTLFPVVVGVALILETLLTILIVLQSKQETAILRALGMPKGSVFLMFAIEQFFLCGVGVVFAFLILLIINHAIPCPEIPIYALVHLFACLVGVSATSGFILAKSPMALLQDKE